IASDGTVDRAPTNETLWTLLEAVEKDIGAGGHPDATVPLQITACGVHAVVVRHPRLRRELVLQAAVPTWPSSQVDIAAEVTPLTGFVGDTSGAAQRSAAARYRALFAIARQALPHMGAALVPGYCLCVAAEALATWVAGQLTRNPSHRLGSHREPLDHSERALLALHASLAGLAPPPRATPWAWSNPIWRAEHLQPLPDTGAMAQWQRAESSDVCLHARWLPAWPVGTWLCDAGFRAWAASAFQFRKTCNMLLTQAWCCRDAPGPNIDVRLYGYFAPGCQALRLHNVTLKAGVLRWHDDPQGKAKAAALTKVAAAMAGEWQQWYEAAVTPGSKDDDSRSRVLIYSALPDALARLRGERPLRDLMAAGVDRHFEDMACGDVLVLPHIAAEYSMNRDTTLALSIRLMPICTEP
ncbi:unnamed protein product, partial [Symbiodinium sp. KB8]